MNALVPKASTVQIDEFTIVDTGEFVPFLDIRYTFDNEGTLQTDLYVKPTDSRSYLEFGNTHPNHVFSAIVYSQCLRLRRTINCNTRLTHRLDELKQAFMNSNYPERMVNRITH
ncbi:MAG: hypothetical protein GY816_19550 [Cytophagales bacterium]|nr:hypothetical protein [Cytophagales bacterium]